ncbi:MAG: energy transducer TonB [Magnetococcales bacterium]|nr:energy transducer TonB [Magnetococcales bacterium]
MDGVFASEGIVEEVRESGPIRRRTPFGLSGRPVGFSVVLHLVFAAGVILSGWGRLPAPVEEPRPLIVQLVSMKTPAPAPPEAVPDTAPPAAVAEPVAAAPVVEKVAEPPPPPPVRKAAPRKAMVKAPTAAVRVKPPESLAAAVFEETAPAPGVGNPPSAEGDVSAPPEGRAEPWQPAVPREEPRPIYPAMARSRGWQGVVVVEAVVERDGAPVAVTVKRSSGHQILDQSAQAAVQRWRFDPARRGGEVVRAVVEVPVRFNLIDG